MLEGMLKVPNVPNFGEELHAQCLQGFIVLCIASQSTLMVHGGSKPK